VLDTLKLSSNQLVQNFVLSLRSMSKMTAHLSNCLAVSRPALSFRLRDEPVHVSPYQDVTGPGVKEWERVSFQVGERCYELLFDQPVLQDFLDIWDYFQDISELTPQSTAIVFEHLFSDVLNDAETRFETNVTIISYDVSVRSDAEVYYLCFEASCSLLVGGSVRMLLRGSDDDLSFLIEGICASNKNDASIERVDFPFAVKLISQNFEISIRELRTFVESDVVLLAVNRLADLACRITISDQISGEVVHSADGLKLTEDLRPLHKNLHLKSGKGDTMSDSEEDLVGFDDLTVSLHIEIDRKEMPMSKLQSLGSGSIVHFDTRTPELVRVYAGQRFFAEGELVTVDEQVGVRLIRMA